MVGGSNPSCPAIFEVLKNMEKLLSYFRLSKAELSKVIFPLKEQVRNAYITVFVVVFVVALFLWIVDLIMFYSLSFIVS